MKLTLVVRLEQRDSIHVHLVLCTEYSATGDAAAAAAAAARGSAADATAPPAAHVDDER